MMNGIETINYMQQMIDDLELIANEPKHFGKEVAHELEMLSYDMFKASKKLEQLIYQYGDI